MIVCRTLDYIVNPELHKFLLTKFDKAKEIGIEIEIELTEPIADLIIDFKEFSEIIEAAFNDAFKAIHESIEKKLVFCMFYKNEELHFIIQYRAYTDSKQIVYEKNLNVCLEKALMKYCDVYCNTEIEEYLVTQQLIVANDKKRWFKG